MKQNILQVAVTAAPDTPEETLSAGKMYEHNAAAICFTLEESLVLPEYRYYAEFVTVSGTARTEYLTPDEHNQITVDLPIEVTAQMTALCVFNIVQIAENGKTEQVIKAKTVRLYFSALENTDRLIDENHAFSVNQLLEAIQAGTFRGEQGIQGEKGEKGDKGDKGESAIPVDATVTASSENPVSSAGIYSFVSGRTERQIASLEIGDAGMSQEIFITKDINGNPLRLRSFKIFADLKYDSAIPKVDLRIRTNSGERYLAFIRDIEANGELLFFHTADTESGVLSVGQTIYGQGGQGIVLSTRHQTICTNLTTPFVNIRLALFLDVSGKERVPILGGSKIVIYGVDAD